MNIRLLTPFCAALLFASAAFGAGEFQRTKDGKTLVWNSAPKAGDEATWFGDRDGEGYATGAGTLTWITARGTVYARYFGNMAHGKFNGPVNAHSKGKTAHATFADGERTSRWTAGRAPSLEPGPQEQIAANISKPKTNAPPPPAEPSPKIAAKPETPVSPMPTPAPPTPSEVPAEGPGVKRALPADTAEATKPVAVNPPTKKKVKSNFDPSLTALVGPPSSLHNIPANTQLTQQDVIDLADTEARVQGYDLNDYERPKADYSAATERWSLFYDQKSADGSPQVGKYFTATVEDKTRKVTIEKKLEPSE